MIKTNTILAPAQVPGLIYWLDANDPSNTGAILSNGAAVSSWIDKSFTKNPQAQATGSNQPSYITNANGGIYGTNSIRFDGSSDGMVTGSNFTNLNGNVSMEIFIVNKLSSNLGSAYGVMVDFGTRGVNGQSFGIGANGTTSGSAFSGWFGDGVAFSFTNASYSIFDYSRTGGGNSATGNVMYVNGTSVSLSNVSSPITPNIQSNKLSVGAYSDIAQFFAYADIQELIIYSTTITSAQRTLVTRYLANKWAISSAL